MPDHDPPALPAPTCIACGAHHGGPTSAILCLRAALRRLREDNRDLLTALAAANRRR
jgi:hypothetical protein